ncbi:MAG: hypothetical protein KDA99_10210, partial [Planctomycetales bacterium]|nr:hypothetical protein [Planctomycetales bacterium]
SQHRRQTDSCIMMPSTANRDALFMAIQSAACTIIIAFGASAGLCAEPAITALAISQDGQYVLTGSQAGITVRSWPDLHVVRQLATEVDHVHHLALSEDDQRLLITGGVPADFGAFQVLAWSSGDSLHKAIVTNDVILAGDFAELGNGHHGIVVACGDNSTCLYELDRNLTVEKEPTKVFRGHSRRVTALELLGGGGGDEAGWLLTTAYDHSLRVWELSSGRLRRTLDLHRGPVYDMAVRPRPRRGPATDSAVGSGPPMVATCGADRTVRFWQPTIGRLMRFATLPVEANAICWTRDGRHLAAAGQDGSILWIEPETAKLLPRGGDRNVAVRAISGWPYELEAAPDGDAVIVAGQGGQLCVVTLPRTEPNGQRP